ncbi:hypothetical protein HOB10_05535 [Candidatus Parcubacteria bacterium]|jgi:hypothetical protein|nr:hypothetical protein [Candidatus Parcubacteria bacterium]
MSQGELFDDQPLFGKKKKRVSWKRVSILLLVIASVALAFFVGLVADVSVKRLAVQELVSEDTINIQNSYTMQFYARHISGLVRAYKQMGGDHMPSIQDVVHLQKGSNVMVDPYNPRQMVSIVATDYDGQTIADISRHKLFDKIGYYSDHSNIATIFVWDRQGNVLYRQVVLRNGLQGIFPNWQHKDNKGHVTPDKLERQRQMAKGAA